MPTIRAHSSKIRSEFAQWLALERAAGARFVVVEGLMYSGKSELTKQPETLSPALKVIELDKFVRRSDGNLAQYDTIDVVVVTKHKERDGDSLTGDRRGADGVAGHRTCREGMQLDIFAAYTSNEWHREIQTIGKHLNLRRRKTSRAANIFSFDRTM